MVGWRVIRSCLLKMRRRLALEDRYGIRSGQRSPRKISLDRDVARRNGIGFGASSWLPRWLPRVVPGVDWRNLAPASTRQMSVGIMLASPQSRNPCGNPGNDRRLLLRDSCCRRGANSALALANKPERRGQACGAAQFIFQTRRRITSRAKHSSEQPQVTAPP